MADKFVEKSEKCVVDAFVNLTVPSSDSCQVIIDGHPVEKRRSRKPNV